MKLYEVLINEFEMLKNKLMHENVNKEFIVINQYQTSKSLISFNYTISLISYNSDSYLRAFFSSIIKHTPEQNEIISIRIPIDNAIPTPQFLANVGSIEEFKILPINPIVVFNPNANASILPLNHLVIMTA